MHTVDIFYKKVIFFSLYIFCTQNNFVYFMSPVCMPTLHSTVLRKWSFLKHVSSRSSSQAIKEMVPSSQKSVYLSFSVACRRRYTVVPFSHLLLLHIHYFSDIEWPSSLLLSLAMPEKKTRRAQLNAEPCGKCHATSRVVKTKALK